MMTSFQNWLKYGLLTVALAVVVYAIGYASAWVGFELVIGAIVGLGLAVAIFFKPELGMYLLAFFLPFERIGSVDIAGTTVRISQVIIILAISAWISRGLLKKKLPIAPSPAWVPVTLFICTALFALLQAPFLERSITVLLFTVFTLSLSVFMPSIITNPRELRRIVIALFLGMLVVTLFGLYQFAGDLVGLPTSLTGLRPQYTKEILGFPRIQSTALEPLYFANYLLIPLSIALAFFFGKSKRIPSSWMLTILGIGTLNVVLTVSRGGYIAFAASVAVLALWYWREALRPRNVLAVVLMAAVVGVLAFRFLNVDEQLESFAYHVTNLFDGASYVERVETFSIAYDIWQNHPLIGIGPGSFGPYASYHPLHVPVQGYKIVNNVYIELLAETGIIGLSLLAILVCMLLVRSYKAWHVSKQSPAKDTRMVLVGLTAALIGVLVQYNTFSVIYITHIWWLVGILIATQNILLQSDTEADAHN